MIFNLMIIFLLIFTIFFYLKNFLKSKKKKKVLKVNKSKAFTKKNLNNWMNLTKKERYTLSKEESISYQYKRKLLLDEIRKEYKKISRGNSEDNFLKK